MNKLLDEHLAKASDSAEFCLGDLEQALKHADPVSSIILRDLMQATITVYDRINLLGDALRSMP